MPRHPEEIEAPPACVGCGKDHGEDDNPLECDKVQHIRSHSLTYIDVILQFSVMLLGILTVLIHLLTPSPMASGSARIAKKTPGRLSGNGL